MEREIVDKEYKQGGGLTRNLVEHLLKYVVSPMKFFQCVLLGCGQVDKIAIK